MKRKFITGIILMVIPFLTAFVSFKGLERKIDREIKDEFEVTSYTHEGIEIPEELREQLPSNVTKENFFRLKNAGELLGYVYLDKAPSKTAEFDYLVILDQDLTIARTKVLVYREEYGGEIGSKRWLRQFTGKSKASQLDRIAGISGATISVRSMTKAVKDILSSVEIMRKNNVL